MRGGKKIETSPFFVFVIIILGFYILDGYAQEYRDEQIFTFSHSTEGLIVDPAGSEMTLSIVKDMHQDSNVVEFKYKRESTLLSKLVCPALLKNFRAISLNIYSQRDSIVMILVEDLDKALFNFTVNLEKDKWTPLVIKPSDFSLNEDSPVKKEHLDPARLGWGFVLLDVTHLFGGSNSENIICLDNLKIERDTLKKISIPAVIDKLIELDESGYFNQNITITKGGTLRIKSGRMLLSSDITVEDGTLEIIGTTLTLEASFVHERNLNILQNGKVILKDALFANPLLCSVNIASGGRLAIDGFKSAGPAASVLISEGANVSIKKTEMLGELLIFPGSNVDIKESSVILAWITINEACKGKLVFPHEKHINSWSLPSEFKARINVDNCDEIFWGLISARDSDVSIEGKIGPLAVILEGEVNIDGIGHNKPEQLKNFKLQDRKLDISEAGIEIINFYANENAKATLRNCYFGEAYALSNSQLIIIDSICDGKGGYIKSEGVSTFHLIKCKIESDVVSTGKSTLILEECDVKGTITATENSTIKLRKTTSIGNVQHFGNGKIIQAQ